MSKLYYKNYSLSTTFNKVYTNIFNHFINFSTCFDFDFIKFLPLYCLSICSKESVITSDLASFIAPKLGIHFDSAIKDINRFLSNPNYDFDFFYSKFISSIISNFKIKHSDKRVHISIDHGDTEDKFTSLMFSLKIGKQSIPLWFKTFTYHDKAAFTPEIFMEGIDFCHNLIKSIDSDADIIFLADRFWGKHFDFMDCINSLNDTYCIRTTGNTIAFYFDKKEKHIIRQTVSELPSLKYHSKLYYDIEISNKRIPLNLAISKSDSHKEPFYILTNGDPKRAIKDYSYRFGAIEFFFKSIKTNGFFLEETQITNLYAFNSLYTCLCIAHVLMTILGIDYSKNKKCYKNYKVRYARVVNGQRRKDISFFRLGLILLEAAINGIINIFKRLILYDI